MTHFELQNSAKGATLTENLLLWNLKRKTNSADGKPEPLAHLYRDSLGPVISPYQLGNRKNKPLALNKSYRKTDVL